MDNQGTFNITENLTVSGSISVSGTGEFVSGDFSNSLTVSGIPVDLGDGLDASQAQLVSVSGHLQGEIDNIDIDEVEPALIGLGTVVVISGTSSITISGTVVSGTGVSDHGGLTGLSDDDHIQYLLIDGTRAMTGTLLGKTGSASSPSFTFDGDSDTGFYRQSSNSIGVTAGNNNTLNLDAAGIELVDSGATIRLPDGTQAAPSLQFSNDPNTGLYSPGTDRVCLVASGMNKICYSGTGVDINDNTTINGDLVVTGSFSSGSGGSDIDDINGITSGSVTVTGTSGIDTITSGQIITVSGFRDEFVAASGSLQNQLDTKGTGNIEQINAISSGALTVTGSNNIQTITDVGGKIITVQDSGLATTTELVTTSGHLQDGIDAVSTRDGEIAPGYVFGTISDVELFNEFSVGDHIAWDTAILDKRGEIQFDLTTTYTGIPGPSIGRLTLAGGNSYKLKGVINLLFGMQESTHFLEWAWAEDNGTVVGSRAKNLSGSDTDGRRFESTAIVSPETDTRYEFRLIQVSGTTNFTFLDGGRENYFTAELLDATVSGGLHIHFQNTESTEWIVEHNLNTSYPMWAAYNGNAESFIPDRVTLSGANAIRVFVEPAASGTFTVSRVSESAGQITVSGVVGPPGEDGATGPQGPQGIQGAPGNPESALVGLGNVTVISGANTTTVSGNTDIFADSAAVSGTISGTTVQAETFILTEAYSGHIVQPGSGTTTAYTIEQKAPYNMEIIELAGETVVGSFTSSLEIDETVIEGIDNITLNTSENTYIATQNNNLNTGQRLTLTASGLTESVNDLGFTIKTVRV